jgi:hypothetical protein
MLDLFEQLTLAPVHKPIPSIPSMEEELQVCILDYDVSPEYTTGFWVALPEE